jgi:antitoxin VapB
MSMNIKNAEAHRLARELAELTGESVTTAVLESLRERLERMEGPTADERAELMLAIGRRTAPRLEGAETNHDRLLYDSWGLPR